MAAASSLNAAVLGFLASKSYPKTRKAFVKEAKLQDKDEEAEGTDLLTAAFDAHIAGRSNKRQREQAPAKESDSDSSSSSSSDDSDSEDEAAAKPDAKRTAAASSSSSDSSSSDSDSDSDSDAGKKAPAAPAVAKAAKPSRHVPAAAAAATADSSDSESSSESDSSSSSDSDSDSSDPSDSEDDEEEEAKKEEETYQPAPASAAAGNSGKFSGKSPGGGKPFQRVDESRWHSLNKHDLLVDNSYATAFGEAGWGHRASEKLLTVRGKDFRHEKTKKKRGGYRGGAIDSFAVNSVKL